MQPYIFLDLHFVNVLKHPAYLGSFLKEVDFWGSVMKRKSQECDQKLKPSSRPVKRQRHGSKIHLLDLSDEILLRTLSYLNTAALILCERVCHKLCGLAKDNELWREKYYNQFVRHRARRLPSLQRIAGQNQEKDYLRYSSRDAQWLDQSHLIQAGVETNWKHIFRIKHNWVHGRAKTSEVQVGNVPVPPVLAKVQRGCLYTVDHVHGLRIWKGGVVKQAHVLEGQSTPSALSVAFDNGTSCVAVGHTDGLLSVYAFDGSRITSLSKIQAAGSILTSVALTWPYMMTMSCSNDVALFETQQRSSADGVEMKCLARLNCDSELSPASLCLRKAKSELVAGIVYAFNRFNTGWCLGLQEIRMDWTGAVTGNRTTSSMSNPIRDSFVVSKKPSSTSRSATTSPFSLHPQLMRAPNSLSYSGCYILAGLPDNTLMVYTVTSTDEKLEINVGRRLWGHTSAVSAAEVTSTGKAVSISAKGEEMRYWELEDLLSSHSQSKTSTTIKPLHSLSKAINQRGEGLGLALKEIKHETGLVRKDVSFDHEQAIVVAQRDQRQIVSCFDFA